MEFPEEAIQSLFQRNPELDQALTLERQRAYNAVTSNSEEHPAGYMDLTMFQETYERLVEEGVVESAFDVADAFTTEFLEEIYRRPINR